MSLWSVLRGENLDGSETTISLLTRRIEQRHKGYKEAQAELEELKVRDADLLERIAGCEAQADVATDKDALRTEQNAMRLERQPIRSRIEEIESSLPQRARLIQEDQYALDEATFDARLADREKWLTEAADEEKVGEELLLPYLDSIARRAMWEVKITAAEKQLFDDAPTFNRNIGRRWQPPAVAQEARERIARAFNDGLTEAERQLHQKAAADRQDRPIDLPPAPRVPVGSDTERYTSPDGQHVWQSDPVAKGVQEACTLFKGCQQTAIVSLSYEAPDYSRRWLACEGHGTPWVDEKIRAHQPRLVRR